MKQYDIETIWRNHLSHYSPKFLSHKIPVELMSYIIYIPSGHEMLNDAMCPSKKSNCCLVVSPKLLENNVYFNSVYLKRTITFTEINFHGFWPYPTSHIPKIYLFKKFKNSHPRKFVSTKFLEKSFDFLISKHA